MELDLNNIIPVITIISFTAALVKYLIIMPLKIAIDSLQKTIEKMEQVISHLAEDQKSMDRRLVAVEASTKSAHKRIDGIDG